MSCFIQGGKAGWDQRKSAELKQNGVDPGDGPGDEYMLQVRGLSILNTKAIQVPMSASSLNSNDTFVVFTRNATYIWNGKVMNHYLRKLARAIFNNY